MRSVVPAGGCRIAPKSCATRSSRCTSESTARSTSLTELRANLSSEYGSRQNRLQRAPQARRRGGGEVLRDFVAHELPDPRRQQGAQFAEAAVRRHQHQAVELVALAHSLQRPGERCGKVVLLQLVRIVRRLERVPNAAAGRAEGAARAIGDDVSG